MPRVERAIVDFEALAARDVPHGTMPRWSDPRAQAVLARVWDAPALLGSPPYGAESAAAVVPLFVKEQKLRLAYLYFTSDPATLPDSARNGAVFQDEIARGTAFGVALDAVVLRILFDPEVGQASGPKPVRSMRDLVQQDVQSSLLSVASAGWSDTSRGRVVAALADNAVFIAAGLTRADRATLAADARATIPVLGADDRTRLQAFVEAMASTTCAGSCATP